MPHFITLCIYLACTLAPFPSTFGFAQGDRLVRHETWDSRELSPGPGDSSSIDSIYIARYIAIIRGDITENDSAESVTEDTDALPSEQDPQSEGTEGTGEDVPVEGQSDIIATVTYAPDGSFKIFVFEEISCGAYCNSNWYAWIHYDLNKKERISEMDFTDIKSITKLPDGKYLLIESFGARPASVMTVSCMKARLLSFAGGKITEHPIRYRKEKTFSFCQESFVDNEPYLRYDEKKKVLSYLYGTNNLYTSGLDVDTIRQGQFRYINGNFVFEKEKVTVNGKTRD